MEFDVAEFMMYHTFPLVGRATESKEYNRVFLQVYALRVIGSA